MFSTEIRKSTLKRGLQTLNAAVDGTVQHLAVPTPGGVVTPGETRGAEGGMKRWKTPSKCITDKYPRDYFFRKIFILFAISVLSNQYNTSFAASAKFKNLELESPMSTVDNVFATMLTTTHRNADDFSNYRHIQLDAPYTRCFEHIDIVLALKKRCSGSACFTAFLACSSSEAGVTDTRIFDDVSSLALAEWNFENPIMDDCLYQSIRVELQRRYVYILANNNGFVNVGVSETLQPCKKQTF